MLGVDRCARARAGRARVLAVDDQTPFLAVLRDLVCATCELEPVAEAQSGERAIEAVREIEPDIVLIDVWMPGIGGIAAAREIKAVRPSTLVILISTTHPDEIPLEPDNICADAVVWEERTRSTAARRLLDAISRPARADALLSVSAPTGASTRHATCFGTRSDSTPGSACYPTPGGAKSAHTFDRRAILSHDNVDVRLPYGSEVRPLVLTHS